MLLVMGSCPISVLFRPLFSYQDLVLLPLTTVETKMKPVKSIVNNKAVFISAFSKSLVEQKEILKDVGGNKYLDT